MSKKIRKGFWVDGHKYYVSADSEPEAIAKKALKIDAIRRGEDMISSAMQLDKWAEECIDTYKTRQKSTTLKKYKNHYKNCVGQFIGTKLLKNIKPLDCQRCLNERADKSKYEIDQAYQIMNFLFSHAVQNGLLPKDPAENLVKPRGYKNKRRSLTEIERKHTEKLFSHSDNYILFELMMYCSCRPDEAAEVKGMDIKTLGDYHILHIRGTKSDAADRSVPIPENLYEKIKDTPPFAYVATNTHGGRHSETSRKRLWAKFKHDMNISMGAKEKCLKRKSLDGKMRTYKSFEGPVPLAEDLVPYDFRHTYCTDLQKKGVDIRTAMQLMGHSDITMTANIYTHGDEETLLAAAKVIVGEATVQPTVQPKQAE